MLFSSPIFLFLFLPCLLAIYFACPRSGRNVVLTAASLLFYAWGELGLVVVMLLSIGMNWAFALGVERLRGRAAGRSLLAASVAANLGLLVYFKYAGFLIDGLDSLLAVASLPAVGRPDVTMPLGISFFTFQAMSYVIDVARGEVRAERNPLNVGLYIALFPQLIAGPIVRYVDVAAEIAKRHVTLEGFAYGVQRFVIGLGKKMLIANSAGAAADMVFAVPDDRLGVAVAWLGAVCYALQIYFDFSGYSDMAIGLGRMFGFTFLENFDYPYVSRSLTEFWRRWHISLSTWFRDYLYIPLGGSRCAPWKVYRNLLIVFLLCGFWHGASWSFVVWGLFHGLVLVAERVGLGRTLERLPAVLRHAYALLLVLVGWVLFRAETLTEAAAYLKAMAGLGVWSDPEYHLGMYLDSGLWLVLACGAIGSTPWLARLGGRLSAGPEGGRRLVLDGAAAAGRLAALAAILVASSSVMLAGTYNPFIYFRF